MKQYGNLRRVAPPPTHRAEEKVVWRALFSGTLLPAQIRRWVPSFYQAGPVRKVEDNLFPKAPGSGILLHKGLWGHFPCLPASRAWRFRFIRGSSKWLDRSVIRDEKSNSKWPKKKKKNGSCARECMRLCVSMCVCVCVCVCAEFSDSITEKSRDR